MKGYAQTSHGATGDGYFETDADLYKIDVLKVHCGASEWVQTVGNISVRSEAFVATASGAPKSLCKDYGFKYNAIQGSHLGQSQNIPNTGHDLCGLNYYGEYGGSFVYYNGAWRGGYLWSGCHWLPTYEPATPC